MEVLLGFYWALWAFPWQLNGSAESFSLLPSPKVTSMSSACATLTTRIGLRAKFSEPFYSLVCVGKTRGFFSSF